MPFAPKIRKQVLAVLEQYAIPALGRDTLTQVSGELPFYFDGAKHWVVRKSPIPDAPAHPLDFLTRWEKLDLLYKRVGRIGIVCAGASIERFGVTREMVQGLKVQGLPVPPGITAFQLEAPAVFHIPAGLPHGGKEIENSHPPFHVLVFDYNNDELFLRYYSPAAGATHHLHIVHRPVLELIYQYVDLLQSRQLKGAQLTLLTAMRHLKEYLVAHSVNISNSAWPTIGDQAITISADASQKNIQLCHNVIDYIQRHLHTSLTLEHLAASNNVSSMHLNRVFKQEIGLTVMRYVTRCRLEAAKSMLREGNERVGDIAQLAGFANSQSFDGVFKRNMGISPLAYRRENMR